jgi:hypothetical protein
MLCNMHQREEYCVCVCVCVCVCIYIYRYWIGKPESKKNHIIVTATSEVICASVVAEFFVRVF